MAKETLKQLRERQMAEAEPGSDEWMAASWGCTPEQAALRKKEQKRTDRWTPLVAVVGLVAITYGTVGLLQALSGIEKRSNQLEVERRQEFCRTYPDSCYLTPNF